MNGLLPRTASVSDLQRDYRSLLNFVLTENKPVVLLKDNKPQAAIVSISQLEDLEVIKEQYEAEQLRQAVVNFNKAKRAGKLLTVHSVDDLFQLIQHEDTNTSLRRGVHQGTRKAIVNGAKKS